MNPRIAAATFRRVLAQLRHDPRTLALLVGAPLLLISLLRAMFSSRRPVFDATAPTLLGVFPLTTMFLVASIATLRERRTGTLERLLAMPMAKLDLLLGYACALAVTALVQVSIVCAVAFGLLGLHAHGGVGSVLPLAQASALLGTALGLLLSAFAATEFQAVQFLPAFLLPQLLICGLFVPFAVMPRWLQLVADATPMHYAAEGLAAATRVGWDGTAVRDLAVVLGCGVVALALGAATLRRRTA